MKTKSRFTLFYSRNRNRIVKAIKLYENEMIKGNFDSKTLHKEKAMIEKILEGTDLAYCSHNLALYGSRINNKNELLDRPVTVKEFNKLTASQKVNFHKLQDFPFDIGQVSEWWRPSL